jgi:hypothetical protein
MRRTSVSLPTSKVAHDPHEKAARYGSARGTGKSGTLENLKTAWMTQTQRTRYIKTGGILLFVIFLFYYLAPTGTDVYNLGTYQRGAYKLWSTISNYVQHRQQVMVKPPLTHPWVHRSAQSLVTRQSQLFNMPS